MVHINTVVYILYQSDIMVHINSVVYIQCQSGVMAHIESVVCTYKYQSGIILLLKKV